MKKEKQTENEIVKELLLTLSKNQINKIQSYINILSRFLFSIGSSLEGCDLNNAEEVMVRYALNPTFGNALMAQALEMEKTWTVTKEE